MVSPSPRTELQSLPCLGWGGFHLPAVDHYGPSFGGVEELDLADEAQESSGIAGDAVVRPAGEVEEAKLPDLVVAFLRRERASVPPAVAPTYPTQHPQGVRAAALRNQPPSSRGGQGSQRVNRCHRSEGFCDLLPQGTWELDTVKVTDILQDFSEPLEC